MNKITFCLLVLALSGNFLFSQSKKELAREVNDLNSELATNKETLAESRKKEKISTAQAEAYAIQIKELQETNASLMSNMNSFTETSSTKLDALSNVMNSLRKKEAELKFINDALTSNDSISLLVLTNFKQTLGENANIKVERGSVVVIMDHSSLFGANTSKTELQVGATESLSKIAGVIKANPDMAVTLEFHADDALSWDIVYGQAASVTKIIGLTADVKSERISVSRKTDLSNSLYIRLHPNFNLFYLDVRQNMKK